MSFAPFINPSPIENLSGMLDGWFNSLTSNALGNVYKGFSITIAPDTPYFWEASDGIGSCFEFASPIKKPLQAGTNHFLGYYVGSNQPNRIIVETGSLYVSSGIDNRDLGFLRRNRLSTWISGIRHEIIAIRVTSSDSKAFYYEYTFERVEGNQTTFDIFPAGGPITITVGN